MFTAFGDRVSVTAAEEDSFRIEGAFSGGLPVDDTNLVVRARNALRTDVPGGTFNRHPAVSIHLEKNLPVASGIGGGSSDAASALKALNRFWDIGLDEPRLARIGRRLGADVPMCLAARSLIASGIGEMIETVPDMPTLPILLVNPGVSVATPTVFRALGSPVNAPLPPLPQGLDFEGLMQWFRATRNDLQAPATGHAPEIATALGEIEAESPAFARMSGSGATCFGLFASLADADRAAVAIRARRPDWFVVATQTLP